MNSLYKIYFRFVVFGLRILQRLGVIKLYQPIPQAKIHLKNKEQQNRVVGRWEAIKEQLPEGKMSVMDIGCNSGYYCFQLAELGHFSLGVEASPPFHLLSMHAKEVIGLNNTAFAKMFVDPENVDSLPKTDCVILLAVFHHWCRAFGSEAAIKMLETVFKNTSKVMFFETGESGDNYAKHLPDMGESPETWLRDLFISMGATEVKVITPSKNGRELIAAYKA